MKEGKVRIDTGYRHAVEKGGGEKVRAGVGETPCSSVSSVKSVVK